MAAVPRGVGKALRAVGKRVGRPAKPADDTPTTTKAAAAPAKKAAAPAKKAAAPAKKAATPAKKAAPANKTAARAKKAAAPAKKAATPAKKAATPAKKAAPAKKTAPAKTAAKTAPVTKAAPATKTAAKAAPATTAAAPAKRASPWSAAELTEIRATLVAQRAELQDDYDHTVEELDTLARQGSDHAGDDQADAGAKTFEREQELSITANRRDLIEQVTHAIDRIDAGDYGFCENCGKPIPKERLRFHPTSTLDVACKQLQERR